MKLETNGVMTLKNINLLNNDFLGKITTLEQEVNVLQQTLGTATQDIGGLQQQIDVINEELNRQTHFRGYYLLNTDIQNLPNSANGDFAFSAESGTVWMYDQNWYNSGDIVPDQVTPASDANPLIDSGTGVDGTSTQYSRGDHQHPLQVSDVLPSKDTSVGTVGQASTYARSDHQHPIQTVNTIPVSDSANGSYGTVESYARNDHSHPINVQTNASIVPVVNGVGNNGTLAYYSRHDHVHPQQLTYDGNVTATKFIKAGGTSNEILCANGDTLNGVVDIEFEQTITGSKTFNNIFQIVPTGDNYNEGIRIAKATNESCQIFFGVDPNEHSGYIEGQWTVGIMLNDGPTAQKFSICQSSDYATTNRGLRISTDGNILTFNGNEFVDVGSDQTVNGTKTFVRVVQIQPNGDNFNEGVRIARSTNSNYCGIYLGCNPQSTQGALTDQWSIVNTPTGELRIGVNIQINQNQGLMIFPDGSTLNFYGKMNSSNIQINPTATGYDDGLRISRSDPTSTGNSSIQLGCSRTSTTGSIEGQWSVFTPPSSSTNNPQSFVIAVSSQAGDNNRGLQISADGNTLTFNGRVL
ncbi:MAG: hypothetical protein EZS28_023670 [Streblomastix strix]|uniref:Uncharacterized protein n=1 Tax=Streblomastix strix TaxID=222440 RepID=A0A5J4VEB4_9EUKA|nr:MAG: hypothetical protein EZS28_023670 [Streblomastix strix]